MLKRAGAQVSRNSRQGVIFGCKCGTKLKVSIKCPDTIQASYILLVTFALMTRTIPCRKYCHGTWGRPCKECNSFIGAENLSGPLAACLSAPKGIQILQLTSKPAGEHCYKFLCMSFVSKYAKTPESFSWKVREHISRNTVWAGVHAVAA